MKNLGILTFSSLSLLLFAHAICALDLENEGRKYHSRTEERLVCDQIKKVITEPNDKITKIKLSGNEAYYYFGDLALEECKIGDLVEITFRLYANNTKKIIHRWIMSIKKAS
jgi:hypothetical protein